MASIDQIEIPNGTYDLATKLEKSAINSFDDGADSYFKKVVSTIEPVQAGSGTPSPTNVRTISGFTECTVLDRQINQWDEDWEVGDISRTTGENSPADSQIRSKNYILVSPDTSYYIGLFKTGEVNIAVCYYDAGKNFISAQWGANGPRRTPINCRYIRFTTNAVYGNTYNNDISINYPATDTSYHAYNGTTATISFGSAGTVYGGKVGLTSGVLTVTHIYYEFDGSDDENWSVQSATANNYLIYLTNRPKYFLGKGLCNYLQWTDLDANEPTDSIRFSGDYVRLFLIKLSFVSDLASLKTYLSSHPLQVCYELATPQTYQLTPTQLRSLQGENNLTSSTGEVTEVEYITNGTIADIYDELYEQGETIYTIVKNESELTTALSTSGSNILVVNAFNLTHTINITQNNTNLTFNKNAVFDMSGKNFAFITVGTANTKPTYVTINNPKAQGKKTSGSIGINLLGMGFGGSINSPTLQSFDVGIKTNSFDCSQLISLYEPVIQGCNIGIDDSLGGLQAVRIHGGRIEGNTNWGIKIGSPNVNFMGTVIEGNGTNLSNGGEVYFTNVSTNRSSAVFVNCYFETLSTTAGNIITANSNWLGNVSLTNCEIYNLAVPVVKYTGSDTKERAINIIGGNVKGTVMVNLPNVGSSTSVFISNVLYDDATNAIDANISASANKFISGKNVSTTSIVRGKSFMSGNTKDGIASADNVYSKILQIDTPSGNNNFIRLTQSASNPWSDTSVGILKGSLHYNSATNKWYQRITSKSGTDAEANWSPLILATTPHTEISTSGSGNSLYFAMPDKSQWLGKKLCICAWRTAESDVNKNPPKFMWEFYVPTNWGASSDDFDIYSAYRGSMAALHDTYITVNLDYSNNKISLQDDGFYARNLNGTNFYLYLYHSLMTYKLVII